MTRVARLSCRYCCRTHINPAPVAEQCLGSGLAAAEGSGGRGMNGPGAARGCTSRARPCERNEGGVQRPGVMEETRGMMMKMSSRAFV